MGFRKPVKLTRIGTSSFGCSLPKAWVQQHYGDSEGNVNPTGLYLESEIDDEKIVIRPMQPALKSPQEETQEVG